MTCSPEQHKLDEDFMREALKIARDGLDRHQWPVGAVLVYKNEIVACACNYVLGGRKDWFGHAEFRALRKARTILRSPWRNDGP